MRARWTALVAIAATVPLLAVGAPVPRAGASTGPEISDIRFNRFCHETVVGTRTVPGLDEEYGGGQLWTDLRIRNLDPGVADHVVTDGTLTVEIANFDGFSFDWSSSVPLDGVFVNAGNVAAGTTSHRFYRYAPETFSGSGVSSSNGATQIDHVSFCYDLAGPFDIFAVPFNRFCHETVVGTRTVPGLDEEYGGGQLWTDLRIRNLDPGVADHVVTDGTLTVEIANFDGLSFDWSSNLPLDGVFVNAGTAPATAHRFYRYAPEATSGASLTSADGQTEIDHISFCYDLGSPAAEFVLAFNRFCHATLVNGRLVPGVDASHGAGETWIDLRARNLSSSQSAYVVSDGVVTVHVTGFDGTSFTWWSDVPLDAVFVNAGSVSSGTSHRLYRYVPEAYSDSGVTSGDGVTPIDHVSFCYDNG